MSEKQRHSSDIEAVYRAVRQAYSNVVQPASVVPAVAVVLWRLRAGELQIYLVKRHPELRFLGGYWSFPGGRVEAADGIEEGAGESSVHIATGVREVREELGILLPVEPSEYLAGGCWVTPAFSPERFRASYLLHRYAGPEPDPAVSAGELVAGRWFSPAELRDGWDSGELLVPPPVWRVVRAMDAHREELESGELGALAVRLEREGREEEGSPRLWYPVAGIGICPLRTPTLPPATHTNAYFVGSEEVVLIDPGSPYPEELAELDRVLDSLRAEGRVVREVLLTHHHGDHIGAASHLAAQHGIPIAAHRETAARARDLSVARHLEDGERIELAGAPRRRLRVLWTPGHAPGHLCFVEEETGFAAAGDMVAGTGTILIDPSEGDMGQYLDSLRRLRSLPLRALLPAHGPVITAPGAKLDEYLAHRLWRETAVVDALSATEGRTVAALVGAVYRDVPSAIHSVAERSLLAHLIKLEAEGRARCSGDRWVAIGSS